ncbi:MAG TPA: beta-aspartyl-peptidase [Thermoanaerobaculia bacterium]|nr:beta-aspartyl-peptidase [Thermoanaerobaculia bacterium]
MLTLIENAEIYAPEPRGRQSILLIGDKIARIGEVDARVAASVLEMELEVIDAKGCVVTPGFIDPHSHLIGGSGEEGFASRSPALQLSEIVAWGITTVVGCLGVDATTRSPISLLAQVKGLREDGITAFLYTGHYGIPPATITGSVRNDLLIVEEVIGVGEIAISDHRAPQPTPEELARVVVDSHVGGLLSRKAGITHFHVGESPRRLKPLFDLLEAYPEIEPAFLYPSHLNRSHELQDEGIELARRGSFVDMDAAEDDMGCWVRRYFDEGGDPCRLTLSSDSDSSAPRQLYQVVQESILKYGLTLEQVLPLVTVNTATVLKLKDKGRLEPGLDADLLVLRRDSLEIVEVIARGKRMVKKGNLAVQEKAADTSSRELHLVGKL